MTGSETDHVDGTILNRDLKPLFAGSEDQIMDWIMKYPLDVHMVWVAGEGAPISIDEWCDWVDDTDE
jgi:hypothetical protein